MGARMSLLHGITAHMHRIRTRPYSVLFRSKHLSAILAATLWWPILVWFIVYFLEIRRGIGFRIVPEIMVVRITHCFNLWDHNTRRGVWTKVLWDGHHVHAKSLVLKHAASYLPFARRGNRIGSDESSGKKGNVISWQCWEEMKQIWVVLCWAGISQRIKIQHRTFSFHSTKQEKVTEKQRSTTKR